MLKPGDLLVTESSITASLLDGGTCMMVEAGTPVFLLDVKQTDDDFYHGPVWSFTFISDSLPMIREFVEPVFVKVLSFVRSFSDEGA